MKRLSFLCICWFVSTRLAFSFVVDDEIFRQRSHDPIAPRDDWGLLHQSKGLNAVDFARRYHFREIYYFKAPEQLMVQPAYVGAVQRDLKRLGYYCGPIDGFYSPAVSEAIAHLQKNYSFRVTGTFTDQVRRALYLP